MTFEFTMPIKRNVIIGFESVFCFSFMGRR